MLRVMIPKYHQQRNIFQGAKQQPKLLYRAWDPSGKIHFCSTHFHFISFYSLSNRYIYSLSLNVYMYFVPDAHSLYIILIDYLLTVGDNCFSFYFIFITYFSLLRLSFYFVQTLY